ncbi:MAG: phosphoglycerate kinase [Bdellovibrionales bacterium]|nr:phosphoglycerate kinase [Bdellovibrionales bacterium]
MKKTKIHFLDELDLKNKNIFMRVDFNVPLAEGKVKDSHRIDKILPSIRYVLEQGGRLVLGSHLGRPDGQPDSQLSLKPVAEYLTETHNLEVLFLDEPDSEAPPVLLPGLKGNQLILLENLRFQKGEMDGDREFAKKLAAYTDIYINEGFSISHRAHASVVLLPELVSCRGGGFLLREEMKQLDYIRLNPKKPFFVILGGSKVKDKIPLLESLIDQADEFFIGGLIAYTFLKAQGVSVGHSPVEEGYLRQVADFIERIKERGKKLWLPKDHVVVNASPSQDSAKTTKGQDISENYQGVDIGPFTQKEFTERIVRAYSLFWNGPMGLFEKEPFSFGTHALARAVASHGLAHRVVGGGHSALAVRDYEDQINHVSTGGGASLHYLQGSNIPGIQSIKM